MSTEKTVTLSIEDIINITESMNKDWAPADERPGQGYLEYLLLRHIREVKGVDFFKSQFSVEGNTVTGYSHKMQKEVTICFPGSKITF